MQSQSTARISDADLTAELTRLIACERKAKARILRALMEFDARRLYLAQGYSSLFTYCTRGGPGCATAPLPARAH